MKSAKWLWGGIALQLATGFTVGYLVYTIGTLITDASSLNVGGAIGGLVAVLAFVAVVVVMAVKANKQVKAEQALN